MRDKRKYVFKDINPAKGCVAFYSHRILSTNLSGVSHNLLFPLADYIEQKQSSVLIGILGGATNLCNKRQPLVIVGNFS